MSYNRADTDTLTVGDGNFYIFSSATDSSYDPNPDYRDLTVSGAGQQYTQLTVSEGGIVRVGTNAVWNGGTVYSGGSAVVSARGKLQNVTIASGGTISGVNVNAVRTATTLYSAVTVQSGGKLQVNGQWNELNNIVVNSGGSIELGAGFTNYVFAGSDTYIASGTWFKNGGAATDLAVANGVVTGFGTIGAVIAYVSNGITIDGGATNHWLYICGGGVVKGVTVDKGNMVISNGGIASNITVGTNGKYLYVSQGGIVRGVTVTTANGYLRMNGAVVSGADVHDNGNLWLKAGLLYNASVTGGAVYINGSGGNISLGGAETVVNQGMIWYNNGDTKDGAVNDTNLAVADGKITGLVMKNSGLAGMNNLTILDGLSAIAPTLSSGAMLYVSNGAAVRGGILNDAKIYVSNGGCISGVVISAGSAELYDATAMTGVERADIVAENLTLSAGRTILRGSNASGRDFTVYGGTLYIQNGAVIDTVHAKGGAVALAYNATVDGNATTLTAKNLNISAGASLAVNGSAGRDTTISGLNLEGSASGTIVGARVHSANLSTGAILYVSSGAQVYGAVASNGSVFVSNGGCISGVVISAGSAELYDATAMTGVKRADIVAENLTLSAGRTILRGSNASGRDFTVYGGTLYIQNGAVIDTVHAKGGKVDLAYNATVDGNATTLTAKNLNISAGAQLVVTGVAGKNTVVSGLNVAAGATANFTQATVELQNGNVANKLNAGTGAAINVGSGARLVDAHIGSGARINIVKDGDGATLTGANTDIADGTLYFNGTAVAGRAANGVLTGFNATDLFKLSIGDGIVVSNVSFNNGEIRISAFGGASVDTATVNAGAIVCNVGANGTFDNVTLVGTGILNLSGTAVAHNTVVSAGGQFALNQATVLAENTTLKAGAKFKLNAVGADTGELLTVDFTEGGNSVYIDNLDRIASSTSVVVKGLNVGSTYTLTTSGAATTGYVCCDAAGLYDNKVQGGTTYTNAFAGKTWNFSTGKSIAVTEFNIGEAKTTAGAITTADTALNTNDRAAKWDSATAYAGNVYLAGGMIAGNAWLDIDGFSKSNANLYGAAKDQDFAGTVNINAEAGVVKNLAGGAGLGGKVGGVKLTVGDGMSVTGAVYAGGMGDVTGATETLVQGGTFSGNVFAGALCNYVANGKATATGDIAFTVNGGTFANNLYAGAAVKSGAAAGVVHTVQNITVELNGGTASKNAFCVYGGGYATGTTESKVYAAGDVDITVTGGSWGKYQSGRGIFGGVYTDKVAASVEDVNINVSGGTLGNIYGGGWAQNGGTSTAGNVSITVAGDAEVNNVFGGGSYSSTSGGITSVGSVCISVAGGDVKNNIFAAGQGEFSTVSGDISVIFTGSNDYTCNVYGYGTQSSATDANDKVLTFDGYTGTLSGNVGGFDAIAFDGDTAATLSGSTIDNGEWKFDYTGRTDALSGTSFLTWSTADFENDTIKVSFADDTQAQGGWNIATVAEAFSGTTFDVEIGGAEIASGLAYNQQIATGDYAGWGFDLESGVLKFKQLA